MDTKRISPYHLLTDEARRAECRRRAVLAVRGGERRAAVAARLHISRQTLHTWLSRADGTTGEVPLKDPGPESKMTPAMRERLGSMVDLGPRACGLDADAWTLPRIAFLIAREFGHQFSTEHVSNILFEMGFSPQKPERQARERSDARVMEWKRTVLPLVGKKSG